MTRVVSRVNAVADSAIGSLGYKRWVDGRPLQGLLHPCNTCPERAQRNTTPRDLPDLATLFSLHLNEINAFNASVAHRREALYALRCTACNCIAAAFV